MSSIGNPISQAFEQIYGKPCWQAKQGHSSFLTFDFGDPILEIREPRELGYYLTPNKRSKFLRRSVTVRGQWHLWIYFCDWSLHLNGKQIARSYSADWRIERAVGALNGQALTRVSVDPDHANFIFEFDLGGVLKTWPDEDKGRDQWMLYEPSGYVLTVRGDGHYSHQLGNSPPAQTEWRPLPSLYGS